MASVKKQLKKLTKRQDALERAMRDLKPKRLRRLLRRPDKTIATMDHAIPTDFQRGNGPIVIKDAQAAAQVRALEQNCKDFGITLYDLDSERQGISYAAWREVGVAPSVLTKAGLTRSS